MDHPLRSHIFLVMKNGKGYTNKLIKLTFVFFCKKTRRLRILLVLEKHNGQ